MTERAVLRTCARALTVAFGVGLASGCVQLSWSKSRLERPVSEARLNGATPGASLNECLRQFGAPHFVWEQPNGAVAIAYAWSLRAGWGVGVSSPLGHNVDASFTFDALSADTRGLALWFDSDWVLIRTQRGALRDLAQVAGRVRPNFVAPADARSTP